MLSSMPAAMFCDLSANNNSQLQCKGTQTCGTQGYSTKNVDIALGARCVPSHSRFASFTLWWSWRMVEQRRGEKISRSCVQFAIAMLLGQLVQFSVQFATPQSVHKLVHIWAEPYPVLDQLSPFDSAPPLRPQDVATVLEFALLADDVCRLVSSIATDGLSMIFA